METDTTIGDGWVTDAALEIVKALKGMQKGDLIQCSHCGANHQFYKWNAGGSEYPVNIADAYGVELGGMLLEEVVGWKPKQR